MTPETHIYYRLTYDHAWMNPDGERKWVPTQKNSPDEEVHAVRLRYVKDKRSIGTARNLRVQIIQETILSDEEVGDE